MKSKFLIAPALMTFAASFAFAQGEPKKFDEADMNKDGILSVEEARTALPSLKIEAGGDAEAMLTREAVKKALPQVSFGQGNDRGPITEEEYDAIAQQLQQSSSGSAASSQSSSAGSQPSSSQQASSASSQPPSAQRSSSASVSASSQPPSAQQESSSSASSSTQPPSQQRTQSSSASSQQPGSSSQSSSASTPPSSGGAASSQSSQQQQQRQQSSSQASSQEPVKIKEFSEADSNKDGQLSVLEARAAVPGLQLQQGAGTVSSSGSQGSASADAMVTREQVKRALPQISFDSGSERGPITQQEFDKIVEQLEQRSQ